VRGYLYVSDKNEILGKILFIHDESIMSTHFKRKINRVLRLLAKGYKLIQLPSNATEQDALNIINDGGFSMVLAPWQKYLKWRKVEAFFGVTRNKGPLFMGYFSAPIYPQEIPSTLIRDHRALLIDFYYLTIGEILQILLCMLNEEKRTGIKPFFNRKTTIYCETWYSSQGQGQRSEMILKLPRVIGSRWNNRSNAIRIVLNSLWSLIYEEGPGKGDFIQNIASKTPRAYFQIGVDHRFLVFRLCFAMSNWTLDDALHGFWPDSEKPLKSSKLLTKYADFLRIHKINDTSGDVEITIGFFRSNSIERAHSNVHSLWIDPVSSSIVHELPFPSEDNPDPYLKPLPNISLINLEGETLASKNARAKDRYIERLSIENRELKTLLHTKEEVIREMRKGGIQSNNPLNRTSESTLLKALKEKYILGKKQIFDIKKEIDSADKKKISPSRLYELDQILNSLIAEEKMWIKEISEVLKLYTSPSQKKQNE